MRDFIRFKSLIKINTQSKCFKNCFLLKEIQINEIFN